MNIFKLIIYICERIADIPDCFGICPRNGKGCADKMGNFASVEKGIIDRSSVNIIKTISDPQLGEIVFRKNTKAKNYILRLQNGTVKVTIPLYGNYTRAKEFFMENRQRLLPKIQNQSTCLSPKPDETELRRKAQSILPVRLAKLAELHGFQYSGLKIRKSRSRWGSCSSKKAINLSFYLLLLPEHLIEYVLLHELCHTVQMNHGSAFWSLLNRCTQNKALELRREIRKYRFEV